VIEEQEAERDPRYDEENWWGELGDFDERFEIGLRITVAGTEVTLAPR
jgi:hypothetical protein